MMYFLTFRNTSEPEPSRVQVTSSDPDLKTSWPASFVFMNESKKKKKIMQIIIFWYGTLKLN